jgi:lipopolysaccharide export system protein LptA
MKKSLFTLFILSLIGSELSLAQTQRNIPSQAQKKSEGAGSPFQGFSQNRNQPINFQADKAEVFDLEKKAILTGRVKVTQGESTMTAGRLVIWYEKNDEKDTTKAAQSQMGSGSQSVRQFDMEGGVTVSSKTQVATAKHGTFNVKTDKAVLHDDVVLVQCQNVMKGDRLDVDIKLNEAKLSTKSSGGRVSGLLTQGSEPLPNGECPNGQTPAGATKLDTKRPVQQIKPATKVN